MAFGGTNNLVTRERVRARIRNLLGESDLNKGRRQSFTTTSAGAAGGSTVVSTELTTFYPTDDGLIGAYLRCRDGANAGEERLITDYTQTSGTVTVDPVFSGTTETAKEYELFERGRFSDLEIEDAIQDAQIKIAKILPEEAKWFLKTGSLAQSTSLGSMQLNSRFSNLMDLDYILSTDKNTVWRMAGIEDIQNIQDTRHSEYATTDKPAAVLIAKNILRTYPSVIDKVDLIYFKLPSYINGMASDSTDGNHLDIQEPWVGDVELYAAFLISGNEKFLKPLSMPIKQGFGIGMTNPDNVAVPKAE